MPLTKTDRSQRPKGRIGRLFERIRSDERFVKISAFVKELKERRGLRFIVCRNFIFYLLILAFALIFTQALRSPLSGVFYVFMLILPLACLVHLLLSPIFIKASAQSSDREVYKNVPTDFNMTVSNEGVIPYPFAEAVIHIPDKNAVRCVTRRVWLTLAPRAVYDLAQNVTFAYRGSYEIGVSCVYVYDIFRMFRLRLDFDNVIGVFVMPRRLTLEDATKQAPSDINSDSSKNIIGVDRSELADIRDYRIGDHMKTIHWQLSSKTQELVVKEFAMNSGKTVYIFADMQAHYDTEGSADYDGDINEYGADGVVETCIAAASRELKEGNSVTLLWFDDRVESGMQNVTMQTTADLSRVFKTFATAPLVRTQSADVTRLATLTGETQTASMLFVTASICEEIARGITDVAAAFGNIRERGAIEVIFCDPIDKVSKSALDAYRERTDGLKLQLSSNGIPVVPPRLL